MRVMLRVCWLGIMSILGFLAVGQETQRSDEDALIEFFMEVIDEDLLEDMDISELLEHWYILRSQPFDLNRVTFEELASIGWLSPTVIQQILNYRDRTGGFISVNELQVIEGLDARTAPLLAEVLTVSDRSTLSTVTYQDFKEKGKHELIIRHGRVLESQRGYHIKDETRSRYLGSPDRLLWRYRYNYGSDLRVALNMEKDPGEQFFAGKQRYGFDHYSVSLQLRNQPVLSNLVVGDYVLQFGQGLGMWSGFSGGKGAILHSIARQGGGAKLHSSANEIDFFRGVVGTLRYGYLFVTPFVSYRMRDGAVQSDEEGQRSVATLGSSGLHRTPSENNNKGEVSQLTYGVNLERRTRQLIVGATFYQSKLGVSWQPADLLRNQYAFSGDRLTHMSAYYQFNIRNAYVFGETALSGNGGKATLNGLLLGLHPHLSLGLLHRFYEANHHSFFGQVFGEGSGPSNERGFYAGLLFQRDRKVSWVSYVDFYSFPWIRYRIDAPSTGVDFLSQLTYNWSRNTFGSVRFRYREKMENLSRDEPTDLVAQTERTQVRVSFETQFGERWRVRSRVESMSYVKELEKNQHGWMIYQDVFYQPMGAKLSGNVRLAFFKTSSYDTRMYAFENDVLFASSYPVYHNEGIRTYLNVRWKISSRMDVWTRYSLFRYDGDTNVGSGLDEIENGRMRSEIKTQIRFKIN